MKRHKTRIPLLTAFLDLILCVCAGLLAGCDLLTPESDLFSPESDTVTVTFNAEGGSPGTQTQTVEVGASIGEALPAEPSRSGYRFVGW